MKCKKFCGVTIPHWDALSQYTFYGPWIESFQDCWWDPEFPQLSQMVQSLPGFLDLCLNVCSPSHVRVLSLRSSVIHGFVTEPWYSHHVPVFMWARGFECARVACSLVCVPCFMLERGVWIPALMSWISVTWRGSDTRAPFSVIVCARSRVRWAPRTLVHVCFVVLHAVRVSIGCVHLCYILCCVARSLYIHWLRAFMLSCLVWTRGLWVFSLAACSCPVLHMAGDLFAGHVLVFLFCVSTWLLS